MRMSTWNRRSPMEHTVLVNLLLRVSILLAPIVGSSATCLNTYEVGGPGNSWIPNTDPNFYITWAAGITFYPGDCLQFNRVQAAYVYQLSESDYQTCTLSNPLNWWLGASAGAQIVSPFPSQSSYPVSFYFSAMATFHCTEGMKFAATVSDPSSTTAAPPPPPGSTNSSSETSPGAPPGTPSGTPPGTLSGTPPATKPGSKTPFGTLEPSAPSSPALSTKSIAGIVAGVVAALTGGAGLAYKLGIHNNVTCCVFNDNGAGNGAGTGVRNEAGNGVRNGAGYEVRNGAGTGVHSGAGHGVRHGVQNGVGEGFSDEDDNGVGYGVQSGVGTSAWV